MLLRGRQIHSIPFNYTCTNNGERKTIEKIVKKMFIYKLRIQ